MLPSLNGFEVLRRLRQTLALPVIMLTARGADVDRIVGLELGADDYLSKPFNPRELVARIRAVLRRLGSREADDSNQPVTVGPLRLDPGTMAAYVGRPGSWRRSSSKTWWTRSGNCWSRNQGRR